MSLKGHLGTIALPELLQWLAIGQKTGTLVISRDDGVYRVAVDSGRIVGTSTGNPDLQLGRWLRDRGTVDEPTMERALRLREATGMSLGRVLLTLQVVSEEELRESLREKAEALISTLFHSTRASFQFVENDNLDDPGVPLSLDATQLVLSAAHRLEEPTGDPAPGAREAAAGADPATPQPRTAPEVARLVEKLPETAAAAAEQGRRRTVSGLTAAAALIGAVALVLAIGRSHVAATAEATADQVVTALPGLAAAVPAAAPAPAPIVPELDFPTAAEVPEPPAEEAGPRPPADGDEAAVAALLARREAAVRDELDSRYRLELAQLRRQLEEARVQANTAPGPRGDLADPPAAPPAGEPSVGEPAAAATPQALIPELVPALGFPAAPAGGLEATAAAAPEDDDTATDPGPRAAEVQAAPTPARLISRPAPVYPAAASRLKREAEVAVRALVSADGSVVEVQTDGRKAGLGFDEAALAAARRSRWEPATADGRPIASWVTLRFRFQLP